MTKPISGTFCFVFVQKKSQDRHSQNTHHEQKNWRSCLDQTLIQTRRIRIERIQQEIINWILELRVKNTMTESLFQGQLIAVWLEAVLFLRWGHHALGPLWSKKTNIFLTSWMQINIHRDNRISMDDVLHCDVMCSDLLHNGKCFGDLNFDVMYYDVQCCDA